MASPAAASAPVWSPCTTVLLSHCRSLLPGQFICDGDFRLHDSMSAIELLEPKMDGAMAENSADSIVKHALTEVLLDFPSVLTPVAILPILDDLLRCLAAFLNGVALPHSLYSFLPFYRGETEFHPEKPYKPNLSEYSPLRVFLLLALKCCSECRSVMIDGDIYLDEEFSPHLFACSTMEEISPEEAINSCRTIEAEVRSASPALADKLSALRVFYEMIRSLRNSPSAETAKKAAELLRSAFPATPNSSAPLGRFFNLSVGRRFVPSAAPRDFSVFVPSLGEAVENLSKAAGQIAWMARLNELDRLEDYFIAFRRFSNWRCCVLVRSALVKFLGDPGNFCRSGPLHERVKKSCQILSPSTIILFSAAADSPQTAAEISQFLQQLTRGIFALFRSFMENPARERKRMGALMEDWRILQEDSNFLDAKLSALCSSAGIECSSFQQPGEAPDVSLHLRPYRYAFFAFTLEWTGKLLTSFLQRGLDLELFTSRELLPFYWQLEFILDVRQQNLRFARREPSLVQAVAQKIREKAKFKISGKAKNAPPPQSPVTGESLLLEAQLFLCRGLYQTLFLMSRAGVSVPQFPPEAAATWFSNRFAELSRVPQPAPQSFQQFRAVEQQYSKLSLERLYQLAEGSLKAARQALTMAGALANQEKTEEEFPLLASLELEPRQLLRSCVAALLSLSSLWKSLSTLGSSDFLLRLDLNKENSPLFPIVSLDKKKQEK